MKGLNSRACEPSRCQSLEEPDPDAAFGLVVLVSNQTAPETIHVGLLALASPSSIEFKCSKITRTYPENNFYRLSR